MTPATSAVAAPTWSGAATAWRTASARDQPCGGSGHGAELLEVSGLTVRYGGVVAVDDVSFTVPRARSSG